MNLPFPNPRKGGGGHASDAVPAVAIRRSDRSAWWFGGGAALAAILLFSALEARRQGTVHGEIQSGSRSHAAPEAIPELVMPALPDEQFGEATRTGWPVPGEAAEAVAAPVFRAPVSQSAPAAQPYPEPYYPAPPLMVTGQPEAGAAAPPAQASPPPALVADATPTRRVAAERLENPATTVVQGTLINAVLETALDSTRSGQARAVVTRDIVGFDGTQLLIPRGTRLYGVYEADVAQGQNRAQIRWTRLLRPDGVSIALDSPAADPLGRAGVKGRVNTHFLQRVGDALLGTATDVGSALATRSIGNSSVVIALPEQSRTGGRSGAPETREIAPTLTVRQGTRITVFVQHDLDFTAFEEAP